MSPGHEQPRAPNLQDVAGRAAYLDGVAASEFGHGYKRVAFELLDVRPGQSVLDVGCGTGDDARRLGVQVGSSGRIVGLDSDLEMIEEARTRSRAGPPGPEFYEGDILALPFGEGTFDRVRVDRVLQMVKDRDAALRELIRVTRPGGLIVASNPGGGSELDVCDRETTRRIFAAPSLLSRDGWSGIEIPNLFKDHALRDILIRPYVQCWTDARASERVTPMEIVARGAVQAGTVSEAEAVSWLAHLREAGDKERFTFVHVLMNVRGTVPHSSA